MKLNDKLFYLSASALIVAKLAITNVGTYQMAMSEFNDSSTSVDSKVESANFFKKSHKDLEWHNAKKFSEFGYVVAANNYLNNSSSE